MTDNETKTLSGATHAELAAEVARVQHVPDRDELTSLLVRYFDGPITDQHVDHLLNVYQERSGLGDQLALHEGIERIDLRGWAWREEVFANHRTPSHTDLLLLLAHQLWGGNEFRREVTGDTLEFPPPKLYCPSNVVGTWEQLEPVHRASAPILWHFDAGGFVRTPSPDIFDRQTRWCVYRQYGWNGHLFKLVTTTDDFRGLWSVSNVELTEREMHGAHLSAIGPVPFRFRRLDLP